MIRKVKTYKNGDIGIIISEKCPICGKKFWVLDYSSENDLVMNCLECKNSIKIKIKVMDLSFRKHADKIIERIGSFDLGGD